MFWRCTELDRRNLKVLGALRYTISKTEKRQQAARTPERLLVNHNDPTPYVFYKCHVGRGSGAYACGGSDLPILERVHTERNPKGRAALSSGCATLSAPFEGATHADTRGRLETIVRVHGFGELAQTHAGGGSLCARLCAQSRSGRRNLGAGGAAA